jgi:hypothetical protein
MFESFVQSVPGKFNTFSKFNTFIKFAKFARDGHRLTAESQQQIANSPFPTTLDSPRYTARCFREETVHR